MDESVMRVLQMLQDGQISPQEAEMLIAALRGEGAPAAAAKTDAPPQEKKKVDLHIDLDDLGERITKAVSKVQPERILKQLKGVTRSTSHWSTLMSARVRSWATMHDERPVNSGNLPVHEENHQQEFHLTDGSQILVENPLGNIQITGIQNGPASVSVHKVAWAAQSPESVCSRMEVAIHGTDSRLDIKVSAPDPFEDGTVDLELYIPVHADKLHLRTTFGEAVVTGIEASVEAFTASGSLTLTDVRDVRGETASGSITMQNIAAAAVATSASGDMQIHKVGGGLLARNGSGDLNASDLEGGKVECKVVSGDILLQRVGVVCPIDIVCDSVSGDISLQNASGSIAMKSVSGDINAASLISGKTQSQTVSGDIQIRFSQPYSGSIQVSSVSGDVQLALVQGSDVRASLSTTSGSLRCEHDASSVQAGETLWSGQLGSGTGTLNVQTISGDIHLLRNTEGTTV